MENNISVFEGRAVRAWHQDGLGDLAFGVLLVVLSGGLLIAQQPWAASVPFIWIFVPVMLAGGLSRWALGRWKASVTIPRIGYVEPSPSSTGQRLVAILSVLALGGLTAFAVPARGLSEAGRVLVPAGSLVFSAVFVYAAFRWSMPRYFALASIPGMFGAWAYYHRAGITDLPFLFLALGLGFAAVGGVRLFRFLYAHPRETSPLS
jgi:hypothetical protein